MRFGFKRLMFSLVLALTGTALRAQTMIDPASVTGGRTRIAPILSLSDVDYERENGTLLGVERKTLGVELSHGFLKTVDGVATFGAALDSKADGLPRDEGGFSVGFGARGVAYRHGAAGVVLYGFLNWLEDRFKGSSGFSDELRTYDLRFGGTFSAAINGQFQPYAGLDLALFRGGTERIRSFGVTSSSDLRKDDILALKLGMNILLGSAMLRPEVTLLGEETFTLAAGFPL